MKQKHLINCIQFIDVESTARTADSFFFLLTKLSQVIYEENTRRLQQALKKDASQGYLIKNEMNKPFFLRILNHVTVKKIFKVNIEIDFRPLRKMTDYHNETKWIYLRKGHLRVNVLMY